MKRLVLLLAIVSMMACAGSALCADWASPGWGVYEWNWDSDTGDSWYTQLDRVEMEMFEGSVLFAAPAYTNIYGSVAGWTSSVSGSTCVLSGPTADYMWWDLNFSGPQDEAFKFHYNVYNDGTLWYSADECYNWNADKQKWQWTAIEHSTSAAVPEPMSIMLGIMGLGSIAGFRKLRRK